MSENAHESFAAQAREFKAVLTAGDCFTPDEIAAMLGSFVLAVYQQRIASVGSPEWYESMVKQTLLAERMIEELSRDR